MNEFYPHLSCLTWSFSFLLFFTSVGTYSERRFEQCVCVSVGRNGVCCQNSNAKAHRRINRPCRTTLPSSSQLINLMCIPFCNENLIIVPFLWDYANKMCVFFLLSSFSHQLKSNNFPLVRSVFMCIFLLCCCYCCSRHINSMAIGCWFLLYNLFLFDFI